MRNILLGLLFLITYSSSALAFNTDDFPDTFSIKEEPCKTRCFKLSDGHHLLGRVIPVPGKSSTWQFVDDKNQLQMIFKFTRSCSCGGGLAEFHVYDSKGALIAQLDEMGNVKSGILDRFYLHGPDSDTPLAVANSNLFGTKHTIYLKNSEQVLIELTRPLFTWSRDSEIKIIDKPALLANIDPNLMVSVLAMHCLHDIELIADVDDPSSPSSLKQELQTNIAEVVESQSTLQENPVALDDAQKKAVVNKVRAMYEQRYDDTALSEEEKIQQFVNFVTETVQAHVLTSAEEQAILTFLVERLK